MSSTALIIAHPGHELVIHAWLSQVKPLVLVLTDGSGHHNPPRTESSRALCQGVGASCGSVFGEVTDRAVYAALLEGKHTFFLQLLGRVADELSARSIDTVCGDALEGYNPTHDLCRALVNAAALKVGVRYRERNLAFALAAPHDPRSPHAKRLGDEAWSTKVAAGERYVELASELTHARSSWGIEAYRVETLVESEVEPIHRPYDGKPHFERVGEDRVRSGAYTHVLRASEHLAPVFDAIAEWAA